jgi:hypothetical protein
MGLFILSAVGLPFLAIVFFTILESAYSTVGIWPVLTKAGLDLCRISLGIAGAMFIDVKLRSAAGTFASLVLFLELILAASAILVDKRATEMGIAKQSTRAFGILAFGIISMVIPAVLIVLAGGN